MILDFANMEEQELVSFKGGEGSALAKMYTDELGKIMHMRLRPGCSIGQHVHEANREAIYIISGAASIIYDGEAVQAKAGQCHYCPKGHGHSITNNGDEDLVLFMVISE